MTKKLEELLNLAPVDDGEEINHVTAEEASQTMSLQKDIIEQVDKAIDKIDAALPTVRELEAADTEMDHLAELAEEKFRDLMDLGMNVEPRY